MSPRTLSLIEIITPLVDADARAEACASAEEYAEFRDSIEPLNTRVIGDVEMLVMDADLTLSDMQELYHEVAGAPRFAGHAGARAAAKAILNQSFAGLNGWRD